MPRIPHRFSRLARRLWAQLCSGLYWAGAIYGSVPGTEARTADPAAWAGPAEDPAPETPRPVLDAPPKGHPERLVPPAPLSPEERDLWARIGGLGGEAL